MIENESLHPLSEISDLLKKKRYNLGTKRGYISLLNNIIITAVFVLITFTWIFQICIASGTDMYPSILDGDVVIGYRLQNEYLRDDVVVCEINGKNVIGRIAARAGDRVEITEEGELIVNGTVQKGEIAFPTYPGKQEYPYIVPEGCVYLLGDYRTNTADSRTFGAVGQDKIISKVVSIFRKRGI